MSAPAQAPGLTMQRTQGPVERRAAAHGARSEEARILRRAQHALLRTMVSGHGRRPLPDDSALEVEAALRAGIRDMLARLRVPESSGHLDPAQVVEAVAELQEVYLELREHQITQRIQAQERVHEGLARLWDVGDPLQLLERVTREVCASCGFERGVLSKVDGSEWVLQGAHFQYDDDWAADFVSFGAEHRPRLTHMMLESEMIRRRSPAIVTDAYSDARTFKPFVEHSRARCYVGAPIMPRGKVIGFFHADHHFSDRPVDEADLERLQAFTEGFAHVYERATLLHRLREQRDRVQQVLSSTSEAMGELSDADIWHESGSRFPRRGGSAAPATADSRAPWVLTQREIDVLGLLAAGATNAEIARELLIAAGTVKSHVKRILRKLNAANRAEAVSLFLRHEIEHRAP